MEYSELVLKCGVCEKQSWCSRSDGIDYSKDAEKVHNFRCWATLLVYDVKALLGYNDKDAIDNKAIATIFRALRNTILLLYFSKLLRYHWREHDVDW